MSTTECPLSAKHLKTPPTPVIPIYFYKNVYPNIFIIHIHFSSNIQEYSNIYLVFTLYHTYERMSKYICTNKFDTNKCMNIFVKKIDSNKCLNKYLKMRIYSSHSETASTSKSTSTFLHPSDRGLTNSPFDNIISLGALRVCLTVLNCQKYDL